MPSSPENALAKFTVTKADDDYAIRIENDAGEVMEVGATDEQLDLIAETLDRLLDADDAEAEGEEMEEDEAESEDEESSE